MNNFESSLETTPTKSGGQTGQSKEDTAMGETKVVGPDLTPDWEKWLDKEDGIIREIRRQFRLGLKDPGKGLTLDHGQTFVEHRNPFETKVAVQKPTRTPAITKPTLPQILAVDRSRKFDPVLFFGVNWTIWRGSADGLGLEGEEDEDQRVLALTQIDLAEVRLENTLRRREGEVQGEERLRRLKALADIRLDALVFQTLWEIMVLIPKSWRRVGRVCFDGTILRSPGGRRYVLYLYFSGGLWYWNYSPLSGGFYTPWPSALLTAA
ncbi:MAG: hypothetical protein HY336_01060 [Candidatus Doudnabacteria bacterium]|nr:hypothetical protein [Candidatus Doudnabacteria bacterium]